jgi:hypothetical protein
MKFKYIIIAVILIGIIGIGIGLKMFFKPHADINKLKTEYIVDGATLLEEFLKDENAATSKYSEKAIEINGKLVSTNKLSNAVHILILENDMEGISCQLDSSWASVNQTKIESLQPDTEITVKGICKGYLMEIKVSSAIIIKP